MASLSSTASSKSNNNLWMWNCGDCPLPPDYEPSHSLCSSLTSTNDSFELAEKRAFYHLERSLKLTPVSEDIAICERALELFAAIKKSSASEKDGGDLIKVLQELNLHTFKENGPLSLPSPSTCSERTLHYAQMNWETLDESVPWSDQATLEWVLYALRSKKSPQIMAALCLVGRINDENEHEASKGGIRPLEEVYGRLHLLVINAFTMMKASSDQIAILTASSDLTSLKRYTQEILEVLEDEQDNDYVPSSKEDEGIMVFSVASCDECECALFLPEFQRCPMNCELEVYELKENDRYCDLCEQPIQPGTVIRRCTKCSVDFCQTCSGPWWHQVGKDCDLCIHHYTEDEKSSEFIRIEKKEDLGEQLADYFEEEGEGEWLNDEDERKEVVKEGKEGER